MKTCLLLATLLFKAHLIAADDQLLGLKVAQPVPVKTLTTIEGKSIDLAQNEKPLVLVFYRGSWCPYCVKQLESLAQEVVPKLPSAEQLVAISVDRPVIAKKMQGKHQLSFPLVSDSQAKILKAFHIANQLDEELVQKYKSAYQIDVEGDSGQTHHLVAHPAVFIVQKGVIKFADVHQNYKERTPNQVILSQLKKLN